jgi:hypothetical protein
MEVDLYGRVIVLTSCDTFTRSYLASEGIELAPQEPPPQDPYEVKKKDNIMVTTQDNWEVLNRGKSKLPAFFKMKF